MANKIDIEKKIVEVSHKTRCMDTPKQMKGEENPCKTFVTTFDFSACSDEEILALASKTCVIAFRTKCKVNDITEEAFAGMMEEPINVHEALKAERKGMTAEEKVKKIASTMTKAEIADLIKSLSEKRA